MKKLVILIVIAIIGGLQIGFAQKKQSSTYNFERAKELVQQKGTPKEILALLNKRLKFIFDMEASTVTSSSVEASFMLKNGYLKEADIKGEEYYSTATGEIHDGTKIRLREIKIGDSVLRNVEASVTHSQQAPLLLGQSVLERFGAIKIDNINSKLIIKQK